MGVSGNRGAEVIPAGGSDKRRLPTRVVLYPLAFTFTPNYEREDTERAVKHKRGKTLSYLEIGYGSTATSTTRLPVGIKLRTKHGSIQSCEYIRMLPSASEMQRDTIMRSSPKHEAFEAHLWDDTRR